MRDASEKARLSAIRHPPSAIRYPLFSSCVIAITILQPYSEITCDNSVFD